MIKENLIQDLSKVIIGQEEVVEKTINQISYIDKGLVDDNKPLGVYLFVGPSGVGKTELAKQIARYYFGNKDSYIKIDMSEFKEAHSISKLIGAAPGYVGYENQTLIVEKLRKHPHSVVILDEIEKAHKDVINVFLNIFDEGYFYDSKKRKIDFTNSIIIMTSNLGTNPDITNIGFINSKAPNEEMKKNINKHFSPEFLNRIDEIMYFDNLNKGSVTGIIDKYIEEYKGKFQFEIDTEYLTDEIIKKEEIHKYGARYIKRELKKELIKCLESKIEAL